MPTIYCDHNFLIAAHDADVGYQADLRSLKDTDVTLVLSSWHWLEMARDPDKERGLSVARFADSLEPMWLLDRISLHARELLIGLFLMTLIPQQISAPITTLEEVVSDLNRGAPAHNFGGSAEFVTHMQGIGDEHPLERARVGSWKEQGCSTTSQTKGAIFAEL